MATLTLSALGCAGGSGVAPPPENGSPAPQVGGAPVVSGAPVESPGFIPTADSEALQAGYGTFGTIGGTIDPVTLALTLDEMPRRAAAPGDTYDIDGTDFFLESPCEDCLQVSGVGLNGDGNLLVEVSLRHPYKDIGFFFSRPDLNVFDARVIAILGGTDTSTTISVYPDNQVAEQPADGNYGAVVNQDGMTSHFDSRAEDTRYFNPPKGLPGVINAYKRYFEDGNEVTPFEPQIPSGWNVMPIASDFETQVFEIDPDVLIANPNGSVPFVLVAEASWGASRNKTLPPDDPGGVNNPQIWLPEFNQHEPWRVDVEVLTNTLRAGVTTSDIQFRVRVSDWQHGKTVDPSFPNLANLSGLAVASNVERVRAAIPGIHDGTVQNDPQSGTGSFADPLLYTFVMQNQLGAGAGTYYGLVAAEDTLNGSSAGPQRIPELGFPRQGAEIINYVGYHGFEVSVSELNFAPNIIRVEIDPVDGIIEAGEEVCFTAVVSDFNVGDTQMIEWDFDYDGVAFEVDGTGETICHTYTQPGTFTVAVKTTDSGTPPLSDLDLDSATILVNGVGFPVRFLDAARRDRTSEDGGQNAMAFLPSGALVLAFSGDGNGEDVFATRTLDGLSWLTPIAISNAGGDQTNIDLALTGNTVMVVFEDGNAIRGALSTNGGASYAAPFDVSANGSSPAIAACSPPQFQIAYENGGDVFVEVNAVGNVSDFSGTPFIINGETNGLQTHPDICTPPNEDRFYVVWEDARDVDFGIDIYATIMTNRAASISTNVLISEDRGDADDTEPSIATGDNGDWVGIAFRSERFRPTGDILLARSEFQGTSWQPAVVLTSGVLGTFQSPSVATRNDMTSLVVAYTKPESTPFATGVLYHISNTRGATFKAGIDPLAKSFRNPNPVTAMQSNGGKNTIVVWTDQAQASQNDYGQLKVQIGYDFR